MYMGLVKMEDKEKKKDNNIVSLTSLNITLAIISLILGVLIFIALK